MKNFDKKNYIKYVINSTLIILFLFFSKFIFSDSLKEIKIIGNENIDEEIIFSIINNQITDYSINNLNEIIKTLYDTGNFKNIEIEYLDDEIILNIQENSSIDNIRFTGNERFKEEEVFEIFNKSDYFKTLNEFNINNFISNLKSLYSSYGYNLINIEYSSNLLMEKEPNNQYDNTAIKILYNEKQIGYVPNKSLYKKICEENIDNRLVIINIKKEPVSNNYGVRVIPEKYFRKEHLDI